MSRSRAFCDLSHVLIELDSRESKTKWIRDIVALQTDLYPPAEPKNQRKATSDTPPTPPASARSSSLPTATLHTPRTSGNPSDRLRIHGSSEEHTAFHGPTWPVMWHTKATRPTYTTRPLCTPKNPSRAPLSRRPLGTHREHNRSTDRWDRA